MKNIIPILIFVFCLSCSKSKLSGVSESDFNSSNITRITERIELLLFVDGSYSENKIFTLDNVNSVIQNKTIYRTDGTAKFFFRGSAEGLIPYSSAVREGYLPFEDEQMSYNIQLNKIDNYILDKHDSESDTIRLFVVYKDQKIIMSVKNYALFEKIKTKLLKESEGKRITVYRYE